MMPEGKFHLDALNEKLDATDNRKPYESESKYSRKIQLEIWAEAFYLFLILSLSIVVLFFTWKGTLGHYLQLSPNQWTIAKKFLYYIAAGMLGGITFGLKYFYRVVARGLWNQDRRVWRIFSPIIASIVAFMTGILIDASIISPGHVINGSSVLAIGFLAGYFADEAVGKMYEVANVIFGPNKK